MFFSFKDEPTPTTSSPTGFQKKATSIPQRPTISSRKLIVPCITRSACVCTFSLASTTSWRRGWALNIHHKEVKMCNYCLASTTCRRSFFTGEEYFLAKSTRGRKKRPRFWSIRAGHSAAKADQRDAQGNKAGMPQILIQPPSMHTVLAMLNIINWILFMPSSEEEIERIRQEMNVLQKGRKLTSLAEWAEKASGDFQKPAYTTTKPINQQENYLECFRFLYRHLSHLYPPLSHNNHCQNNTLFSIVISLLTSWIA